MISDNCTPGPKRVLSGCVYNGQQALAGMDFSGSDLYAATFNGANLAGANFNGANLTKATFDGAHLLGASFNDATLTGATWGVMTICPDGLSSGDNGATCLGHLTPKATP
jgi:Pentapeptide repeats (8 copies)